MQILIFLIKNKAYAIEIKRVDTIEKLEAMTYIPKAREEIMGLISSRGHVISVINTGMLVKHVVEQELLKKLIIITVRGEKLALAVTDIEDVIDIEASQIEYLDDNKDTSVIDVEGKIVMLLTENKLETIY